MMSAAGDYVILLHGMGRTAMSMHRLAAALRSAGYQPVNRSYPSRRRKIHDLSEQYLRGLLRRHCPDPTRKIHFVTHSLGGIIVRYYLRDQRPENLGRIVMLCPPNQGSPLADYYARNPLMRIAAGRSIAELGTDPASLPKALGPVDYEVGIIAGDRSLNPILARHIAGRSDGKVSVASAELEGMRDFLVIHKSHTWIMYSQAVIDQILCFLSDGRFRSTGHASNTRGADIIAPRLTPATGNGHDPSPRNS
jgi:pimeloyl-ACP methyl ester carboxylesterase